MMDELFSCRNCIHNCGQSLTVGPGSGYCLQHESVIWNPDRTTCKYLHRKDLPSFVVEEGTREHAAEFAGFPLLVSLDSKKPIEQIRYSEKLRWEKGSFDPIVHALAQYYKVEPRWGLISAFSSGVDGRRSLTHSSLVRHYMDRCGTWKSSYRLVLGLLEEIDVQPQFEPRMLIQSGGTSADEAAREATWDVVLARLAALQEYGWHAGLESLMWVSDALDGSLAELNWPRLQAELANRRRSWIQLIITSAKEHHEFFPPPEPDSRMDHQAEE
jgi:hypothetical protein